MIKLQSLLNWSEQGLNANEILAYMVTPTQNDMVEWDGEKGIYFDSNLEELFVDLGWNVSKMEESVDLEKANQEDVESSIVFFDKEYAVEFDMLVTPNRFDSDVPENVINFNTGRIVGTTNREEAQDEGLDWIKEEER
ncbi:hypothetical protein CVD28_24480 [Bacillus sp. M6-12]|uniref:hypothetical protein n=1 Tax=Bacillus sp. M6-12 TaxID=2054166 RepID=UPI000C781B30|nr:hypothetical protein [Bacillus sp. M6-12]PLS15040.1 hypothetical protein CVD28_24480 [Bacillus sp. M6-12]